MPHIARKVALGMSGQIRNIHALIIRDLMMRYGREHLGFVWVILEPMILTTGVLFLWSLMKGGQEQGVKILELVLTGYMPLTLWRHLTNPMVFFYRANAGLRYHYRITLYDLLFSRLLLEFGGTTAALVVVASVMTLAGLIDPVQDWTLLIGGWLMMGLFASGFGMLIIIATEQSEIAEKFIQPFQYLLVPLSGTFFMVEWLPVDLQNLILYNPMIHCFEMFRAGLFGDAVPTHFSWPYVLTWACAMNCFGLWGIHRIRRNLQIV